ncbi:MAG: asparagine synthase-related protein, partial [Gemmatimonadota bacterium]
CGVVVGVGEGAERSVVEAMVGAAAHRGPDGAGYWVEREAGLAHQALSLGPVAERQPVVSAEGWVLVADARVDNRRELRGLLGTDPTVGEEAEEEVSDARLILAAYRRWGTEAPARIIGDFAFVVWDPRRRSLFAARDPLGMRALYYRVEPRRTLFATELKQILAAPGVPVRIFEPAVAAYLAGVFGPPEWSFYEGIAQLAPAHALWVGPEGHRTWRYWEVDPEHRLEYAEEEEYAERFRELFLEAVRCRLRSSHPVGILLSGGLDSGSIASAAGWLREREGGGGAWPELRAYCFAFEELPECDERHISAGIVRRYALPATDVPADDAWPLKDYPAHGPDRDEPFLGVYQPLLDRAFAAAREHGTRTLLSGDRGDLTMGESIYDLPGLLAGGRWWTLAREIQRLAQAREQTAARVVRSYLLHPIGAYGWPRGRMGRVFQSLERRHARWRSPTRALPPWLSPDLSRRVGLEEVALGDRAWPPLRGVARRQRYDSIFTPLHVRGMIWSERSYARFGLSFADPWSDRRIVEFALGTPQRILNRVGEEKRLTRRAMEGLMPAASLAAARKISPYPHYHRALTRLARPQICELLHRSEAGSRGYLNAGLLSGHYEAVLQGAREHACFWWALTLEMWLRTYW